MDKPKILADKIMLAELLRKHWNVSNFSNGPRGVYWQGVFTNPTGGITIRVYFQRYARNIQVVDYVSLHWYDNGFLRSALRPKEIKTILQSFDGI